MIHQISSNSSVVYPTFQVLHHGNHIPDHLKSMILCLIIPRNIHFYRMDLSPSFGGMDTPTWHQNLKAFHPSNWAFQLGCLLVDPGVDPFRRRNLWGTIFVKKNIWDCLNIGYGITIVYGHSPNWEKQNQHVDKDVLLLRQINTKKDLTDDNFKLKHAKGQFLMPFSQ